MNDPWERENTILKNGEERSEREERKGRGEGENVPSKRSELFNFELSRVSEEEHVSQSW